MKKISLDWVKKNKKIFKNQKKLIILAGAGTSVGSGLPTYRKKNSIFDKIKQSHRVSGETFFTADFINENRSAFLKYITQFYTSLNEACPSETHNAYQILSRYNKNFRVYTQNIDCLEERAGLYYDNRNEKLSLNLKEKNILSSDVSINNKIDKKLKTELVYLHGNLKFLSCTKCIHSTYMTNIIENNWQKGIDVDCDRCIDRVKRIENKRLRRITYESGFFNTNIIMYDMEHPDAYYISTTMLYDRNISLFLIIGTSMKVYGVKKMGNYFLRKIKENKGIAILINQGKANGFEKKVDLWFDGNSDEFFNTIFN